jgi:hypothetical protein
VEDCVNFFARGNDGRRIANISLHDFDSVALQCIIGTTAEDSHIVSRCQQLFHNIQAQESTAARYKCPHW